MFKSTPGQTAFNFIQEYAFYMVNLWVLYFYMRQSTIKQAKMTYEPNEDRSASLIRVFAVHIRIRSLPIHRVHSKDSDQTGQMPRDIWVLARHTYHFADFVVLWLIYLLAFSNVIFCYHISYCMQIIEAILSVILNVRNFDYHSHKFFCFFYFLKHSDIMLTVVPDISLKSLQNF